MARQKIKPAYISANGNLTTALSQAAFLEDDIQTLVHQHPGILPLSEIDPAFEGAVSICRELWTPKGRIDNLLLTPAGLPVVVECKLWRNPQARREVVGQVLEYARELSRFTSADLQREASKRGVASLFEHVRQHYPDIDEISFHDTLTRSLARGRFLLLIVGDGISANVEAIFEQLSTNGSLHFSFGLVELPIFTLPDGARLAVPRVIARTGVEIRKVVELPNGMTLEGGTDNEDDGIDDQDVKNARRASYAAGQEERAKFWTEFLEKLTLDDPEQPRPKASSRGSITFTLPVPGYNSWLTAWRMPSSGEVGIFLSFRSGSIGQRVAQSLIDSSGDRFLAELGGTASIGEKDGIPVFRDRRFFGDLTNPEAGSAARAWLAERVNRFVNVLRPAVRSAAVDLEME